MCKIKQDFDRNKLRKLLSKLVETHERAESVTNKIENELLKLNKDSLNRSTLIQFSKWCNTNPPYSGELKTGGQQVAQKISMLLFGKVIDRMD